MFTVDGQTFHQRVDYDAYITENAESFTVMCKNARGQFEHKHRRTRRGAERVAQHLANKHRRNYRIYARYKNLGCHVTNFYPE